MLIGNLSEIPWWSGPWDLGKGTLQWDGLESLLNHHPYMELLDSKRDKFNKELKRGGPIIRNRSIEARGSKKGRNWKNHEQVSF